MPTASTSSSCDGNGRSTPSRTARSGAKRMRATSARRRSSARSARCPASAARRSSRRGCTASRSTCAATGCAASGATPFVQAPEDVDLIELAAAAEPSESIEDLVARKDLIARGRARDGAAARGAADGDRPEGISRAHVSGDRGSGRLSAEHGEDAVVSGADGAAARAGQRARAIARPWRPHQ